MGLISPMSRIGRTGDRLEEGTWNWTGDNWEEDWWPLGIGLATAWKRIGRGLVAAWKRTGDRLE